MKAEETEPRYLFTVMDAIIIAMEMLDKHCRHLKWKKKVYLFTNAENPMNNDDKDEVVRKAKDMGVSFNVM